MHLQIVIQLGSSTNIPHYFNFHLLTNYIDRHWLPRIIGNTAMATYGLDPGSHVYNSASNPTLSNVFATAAFRFGHTMLPEKMTIGETDYDLVDLFYKPKFVRNSLGKISSLYFILSHSEKNK